MAVPAPNFTPNSIFAVVVLYFLTEWPSVLRCLYSAKTIVVLYKAAVAEGV